MQGMYFVDTRPPKNIFKVAAVLALFPLVLPLMGWIGNPVSIEALLLSLVFVYMVGFVGFVILVFLYKLLYRLLTGSWQSEG